MAGQKMKEHNEFRRQFYDWVVLIVQEKLVVQRVCFIYLGYNCWLKVSQKVHQSDSQPDYKSPSKSRDSVDYSFSPAASCNELVKCLKKIKSKAGEVSKKKTGWQLSPHHSGFWWRPYFDWLRRSTLCYVVKLQQSGTHVACFVSPSIVVSFSVYNRQDITIHIARWRQLKKNHLQQFDSYSTIFGPQFWYVGKESNPWQQLGFGDCYCWCTHCLPGTSLVSIVAFLISVTFIMLMQMCLKNWIMLWCWGSQCSRRNCDVCCWKAP